MQNYLFNNIIYSYPLDFNNLLDQILNKVSTANYRKINKPIILYSSGKLGKLAIEFFEKNKIHIQYTIDKNFNLNEISQVQKKLYMTIICENGNINETYKKLYKNGCNDIIHFYDIFELYDKHYYITNGWLINELNIYDKIMIRNTFDNLYDDMSKIHYLQFITWHKFRKELIFENSYINTYNKYLIPEIESILNKNETFIDIGAYDGQISFNFMKKVDNKFNQIHMFEPDKFNNKNIKDILYVHDLNSKRNIFLYNYAIEETNNNIGFNHGNEEFSKIKINTLNDISMHTLDYFNLNPTIIKYNINGDEFNALKGSIETIKRNRPILMIELSNTINGLYEISNYIINTLYLKDYKFIIRSHNYCGIDCVLYAIPKEK